MNPIVVTAETLPPPQLSTVLFHGIVNKKPVALSPLLTSGGQLYSYQIEETGELVSPRDVTPIKAAKNA